MVDDSFWDSGLFSYFHWASPLFSKALMKQITIHVHWWLLPVNKIAYLLVKQKRPNAHPYKFKYICCHLVFFGMYPLFTFKVRQI